MSRSLDLRARNPLNKSYVLRASVPVTGSRLSVAVDVGDGTLTYVEISDLKKLRTRYGSVRECTTPLKTFMDTTSMVPPQRLSKPIAWPPTLRNSMFRFPQCSRSFESSE